MKRSIHKFRHVLRGAVSGLTVDHVAPRDSVERLVREFGREEDNNYHNYGITMGSIQ